MADSTTQESNLRADEGNSAGSSSLTTNGKRKAETELFRDDSVPTLPVHDNETDQPLSKNQLKRLKRQQQYEVYKEERKVKRRDKRHAKQERKRAEREAKIAAAEAAGIDPETVVRPQVEPWRPQPVPVTFIIDCDFEEFMREPEIVSLSSQVVRSYAMSRKARYQPHLYISSWKGKMRARFETVLRNTHESWKGVRIVEEDFVEAARKAKEQMAGLDAGELTELLGRKAGEPAVTYGDDRQPIPENAEPDDIDKSVVYLSSESPYTLEKLEPNTSYVVGGLVDRNREKGLCYKRAQERKVRTAKLPIGEYMAMQSRYVLTTNQVIEIMVKWLECGDWGEAFIHVIPKRKGGTLKKQRSQADTDELAESDDIEGDDMVDDAITTAETAQTRQEAEAQ